MTRGELAAKVEWEGGVAEAITGYGLSFAELPDDAPRPVVAAWARLYHQGREDIRTIEDWLDGPGEAGVREPLGSGPGSPPAGVDGVPGAGPVPIAPGLASYDPGIDWPVIGYHARYELVDGFDAWMDPDGTWHYRELVFKPEKSGA